jgi:hypothetical protein
MVTWRLKACPRCGGDTFVDNDYDGWFEQCLLCSHRRELKKIASRPKTPVAFGPGDDELSAV